MTVEPWPVVRRYPQDRLGRIRMPVGGIGTGCVSLGGRGQLLDWELFNRPSKGFSPSSFFAVHVDDGTRRHTRALEVALSDLELEGPHGSRSALHGLPRFRRGRFAAAFPLGAVEMDDPDLPVTARVEVFNPLVPDDAEASGWPMLVHRTTLTNTGAVALSVSVCASLENVVGSEQAPDGRWRTPPGNHFTVQRDSGVTTLLGSGAHTTSRAESAGTVALSTSDPVSSLRTTWARRSWGDSLLEFWDDLHEDGQLDEPVDGAVVPTGSLVSSTRLEPGASTTVRFVVSWHFPHRYGWTGSPASPGGESLSGVYVGNHYAGRFLDAADVAVKAAPALDDLERRTVAFVRSVTDGDLPVSMQDAALSNLAVLKSPVCFRIEDGTFLAWEGSNDDSGSCHGSCTHVWNYQYALESLFPELAWTMRDVELVHSLDDRGAMSFRAGLPLESAGRAWPTAAADGQMGALLRLLRTYRAAPDRDHLLRLWPAARRAMEFAWVPNGWDADRDGLMEGCQHNTMDVEYYGPSGVNQSWYLAALAAVTELASEVGDQEFAETCEKVLRSGARLTDAQLFNGEYYQQRVVPVDDEDTIAPGLRIRYEPGADEDADEGADDLSDPDLQIGAGCTTDQLVGDSMARVAGLDTGLDREHVRAALTSIERYNHRSDFHAHFNHLRTYAAVDEAGLLNCTFPRGDRPRRPFPYCNEVWTGLEYTAAVGLLLEGRDDLAVDIVADVRDRYDGRRRNPFDEVECGHHYVRSMASWGLVEAWQAAHPQHTAVVRPTTAVPEGIPS